MNFFLPSRKIYPCMEFCLSGTMIMLAGWKVETSAEDYARTCYRRKRHNVVVTDEYVSSWKWWRFKTVGRTSMQIINLRLQIEQTLRGKLKKSLRIEDFERLKRKKQATWPKYVMVVGLPVLNLLTGRRGIIWQPSENSTKEGTQMKPPGRDDLSLKVVDY